MARVRLVPVLLLAAVGGSAENAHGLAKRESSAVQSVGATLDEIDALLNEEDDGALLADLEGYNIDAEDIGEFDPSAFASDLGAVDDELRELGLDSYE